MADSECLCHCRGSGDTAAAPSEASDHHQEPSTANGSEYRPNGQAVTDIAVDRQTSQDDWHAFEAGNGDAGWPPDGAGESSIASLKDVSNAGPSILHAAMTATRDSLIVYALAYLPQHHIHCRTQCAKLAALILSNCIDTL